jgi:multimeric flavodoxin WrbA
MLIFSAPNATDTKTRRKGNMEMKKIIGLSTGRTNGNSEMLLKHALMAAEKHGLESEIIRANEHDVKPCTGCEGCVMSLHKTGVSKCSIRGDDAEWLLTKILVEADALIMSMPIYHLVPNSTFFLINHRQHPVVFNNPGLLSKTKPGAIICVGGGTPNYTPLGLMSANIMVQHAYTLVDQIQVTHHARAAQVLVDSPSLDRAARLGDNVARSALIPPEEMAFMGDDSPVSCPVCHCDILKVETALPHVVCPVCDVHGVLMGQGEKMTVAWDPGDVKTPRFSKETLARHLEDLKAMQVKYMTEYREKVQELKKPYVDWGTVVSSRDVKEGENKDGT